MQGKVHERKTIPGQRNSKMIRLWQNESKRLLQQRKRKRRKEQRKEQITTYTTTTIRTIQGANAKENGKYLQPSVTYVDEWGTKLQMVDFKEIRKFQSQYYPQMDNTTGTSTINYPGSMISYPGQYEAKYLGQPTTQVNSIHATLVLDDHYNDTHAGRQWAVLIDTGAITSVAPQYHYEHIPLEKLRAKNPQILTSVEGIRHVRMIRCERLLLRVPAWSRPKDMEEVKMGPHQETADCVWDWKAGTRPPSVDLAWIDKWCLSLAHKALLPYHGEQWQQNVGLEIIWKDLHQHHA
eukprot:690951-Amphidinium_carterae.2